MGLARTLQRRGFHVEYWGHPAVSKIVGENGFTFRMLGGLWIWYEPFFQEGFWRTLRRPASLRAKLTARRNRLRVLPAELARFERSLDQHLDRCAPDLVILDPFVLPYWAFIRRRGIPCVVLGDKPVPAADPCVPPPTSSTVPSESVAGRARVTLAWAMSRLRDASRRIGERALQVMGGYTPEQLLQSIEQRSGISMRSERVRRWIDYDLHFRNVEEWAQAVPETDFPRRRPLPPNIRYIGAFVDFERVEPPPPVQRHSDTNYFIYVSMGTAMPTREVDVSLIRRIIEAFGDLPGVQVAVAMGRDDARSAVGSCPANVQMFRFLPQMTMLRMADLAITHAGANAVRECIATQTPTLVFPRAFDQRGNGARVVYHGVGLGGARWLDSAVSIRRKAFRLLEDPRVRERLRRLSHAVSESEPVLLDAALRAALGARSRPPLC